MHRSSPIRVDPIKYFALKNCQAAYVELLFLVEKNHLANNQVGYNLNRSIDRSQVNLKS